MAKRQMYPPSFLDGRLVQDRNGNEVEVGDDGHHEEKNVESGGVESEDRQSQR